MDQRVVIMSGLPGSGKSYYVKHMDSSNVVICSADAFHIIDGKYCYRKEQQSKAHDYCLTTYLNHLIVRDFDLLVVDNTNTMLIEIAPYYRLATAFGFPVDIVRMWCDPLLAHARNQHEVPLTTVIRMYQNMLGEPLPAYWQHQIIAANNF